MVNWQRSLPSSHAQRAARLYTRVHTVRRSSLLYFKMHHTHLRSSGIVEQETCKDYTWYEANWISLDLNCDDSKATIKNWTIQVVIMSPTCRQEDLCIHRHGAHGDNGYHRTQMQKIATIGNIIQKTMADRHRQ